jgi:hypothetical protein
VRQVRLVVVAAAVAVATFGGARPGGAETVRSGLARGQLARVVPYVGIPGLGAGVGVAQAEVDGGGARASAGMADFGAMALLLGAVGSVVPVPAPDLPSPVSADSRGTKDVERNPVPLPVEPPAANGAPATPAPAYEEAHAATDPAGRARARGPELAMAGLFTVNGGESRAEATISATGSTVTLGRLALGGGAAPEVVLSDLVWTARQEMGKAGVASFSIGSVTVAGQALPLAGVGSTDATLKSVNDTLAPAGLRLDAPVATGDLAGASVSSLVLQVRNPETTAGLLREAAKPVTPVLNTVIDGLLAAAPDAAGARLVVNALLATGTGRGGGRLELGGASARLGTVEVASPAPVMPPAGPEVSPPAFLGLPAPAAPPVAALADPIPTPEQFWAPGSDAPVALGLPLATPAPPGATRTTIAPAAPGGSNLGAVPTGATAPPGGASAGLVLGAALAAIAVLALSDKLRLRRATADAEAR